MATTTLPLTRAETEARARTVEQAVLADKKSAKEISFDVGMKTGSCRNLITNLGFTPMLVRSEERQLIRDRRAGKVW